MYDMSLQVPVVTVHTPVHSSRVSQTELYGLQSTAVIIATYQ